MDKFNEAYAKRPLDELCSREITIDIYGDRCVYINDHRVQGGKPYATENIPIKTKHTTVRDVLEAFSEEEIHAYLKERVAVVAYCAGARNYMDAGGKNDK